jgi:hypothetical protein
LSKEDNVAKIYKRSDRLTVKIDDVTLKLAPLSIHQKVEIQTAMFNGRTKADLSEATRGVVLSLKYSVKGVEGIEDADGNAYQLQFEGDALTDACADDLMNLEITQRLSMVCAGMLNGIPSEFTDQYGNKMDGVEVVKPAPKEQPAKNA